MQDHRVSVAQVHPQTVLWKVLDFGTKVHEQCLHRGQLQIVGHWMGIKSLQRCNVLVLHRRNQVETYHEAMDLLQAVRLDAADLLNKSREKEETFSSKSSAAPMQQRRILQDLLTALDQWSTIELMLCS